MAIISRSWGQQPTATPGVWRNRGTKASNKSTANVAALGTRAPLLYGNVQTTGLIAAVQVATAWPNYGLYLLVVWGEGPITAIDGLVADGMPSYLEHVDYLGTANQGVNPWLATVIPGYSDTLRGTYNQRAVSLAYSVIKVKTTDGFPSAPTALIRGLALYDPRTGLTAYSTNPALILCDLLTRAGETVDWTASLAAINYCDETVGISPDRWTCSLVIANPADVYEHVETLRGYAHCLIDHTATGIRLVPDKAASVSRALTARDVVAGSLVLSRPARRDTPTCVRIGFTDTAPPAGPSGGPWGTRYAAAEHPGIVAGELPWIESGLSLPGIQFFQEASRTAIERLNAYTLRNLYAECTIRDEGLAIAVGDVVTLTHPIGLVAKPLRVLSVDDQSPGRYQIKMEEYDPAVYSSAIVTDPTYDDTPLPSPFDVPAPMGILKQEEMYRLANGRYATRLRFTWNDDDYPYAKSYDLRLYLNGKLIWSAICQDSEDVTSDVMAGTGYELKIRIIAALGITGPWSTRPFTVVGYNYPPTDVENFEVVEIGGQVRMSWQAAFDTDIWRYEIRYGASGSTWETATLLERVDGLRCITDDIQEGTWLFFIKAMDAIGQYSANAASNEVTVTTDNDSFFLGTLTPTISAYSVNIFSHTDRYGKIRAWSEKDDVVVNTVFTSVANTYARVACTYSLASASTLFTLYWDLGLAGSSDLVSGTMTTTLNGISAKYGSITKTLQTSLNTTTWTDNDATAPVKGSFAYARVKIAAAANSCLLLTALPTMRMDAVVREESGRVTTVSSGPKRISLKNTYGGASAIMLTPSGTASRAAVYDAINLATTPQTFDIYLFNASGTQIAGDVSYRFQGV